MSGRRVGILFILLSVLVGFGLGDLEKGNRLFRAGKYAEAVAAYEAALKGGDDSPELEYNLGTALLRLGRFDDAQKHLEAALKGVEPSLRQRTLYNLGNRYLTDARGGQAPGPQRSKLLSSAVQSYQQALRLHPNDMDAKWNYELALRDKKKQPKGGGGQGKQQPKRQPQGGGGGGGGQQKSQPQPQQGNQQMTKEQARRILAAAEQDERQLYRQRAKKGRPHVQVTRDW